MGKTAFFDTHCHYDHPQFKKQGPELVNDLRRAGIEKFVIPAISVESNQIARDMFDEEHYPFVFFASGIHPRVASSIVDERFNWSLISGYLAEDRTVAVKTGLDLSDERLTTTLICNQKNVLHHLLRLADEHDLPVVLHVRDAASETIEELKKSGFKGELEVHCFLYDKPVMKDLLKVGVHYFGIGGAVTRPENIALREAVISMPLESILLETDSPFQKPYGYCEKLNTSLSLEQIANEIAVLRGINIDEVMVASYDNSLRFFGMG